MDKPRDVPASITISEAEQFWSEGADAYHRPGQIQPENHPFNRCAEHGYAHCVWCSGGPGIDMPGVGRVPLATVPGSVYASDQDEHNGLLIKLLFAARRLAMSRIHAVWPSKRDQCLECGQLAHGEDVVRHQRHCRAGDVLDVLDQLQSVGGVKSQNGKEVAENPPEHKVPAVASAAAGIPVSVIVSVSVLNQNTPEARAAREKREAEAKAENVIRAAAIKQAIAKVDKLSGELLRRVILCALPGWLGPEDKEMFPGLEKGLKTLKVDSVEFARAAACLLFVTDEGEQIWANDWEPVEPSRKAFIATLKALGYDASKVWGKPAEPKAPAKKAAKKTAKKGGRK